MGAFNLYPALDAGKFGFHADIFMDVAIFQPEIPIVAIKVYDRQADTDRFCTG